MRGGLALLVGLGVLGAGGVAPAQILSADLRVDGMSCPFCAFGIEKKLLEVDGVEEVAVGLDEGLLRLRLSADNTATPAAFEAAVGKAGFELRALRIEVRGRLEAESTETWLQAHRGLRLRLAERSGDGEQPLSPALREGLHTDDQGRVAVSGRVLGSADAPRLVVDAEALARGRP